MDINFSPDQDIMSDVGFSNMLYQVLNLKPGAALWAAPGLLYMGVHDS